MKVHSPEWFDQQILAAQKRVSEWPEWMKQVAVPSRPTTDAEPPIELASEHMQIVGACNTIDDLAMAVKQLCHAIKRHQPDSDTAARAMQLLQKHNLIGSPLR